MDAKSKVEQIRKQWDELIKNHPYIVVCDKNMTKDSVNYKLRRWVEHNNGQVKWFKKSVLRKLIKKYYSRYSQLAAYLEAEKCEAFLVFLQDLRVLDELYSFCVTNYEMVSRPAKGVAKEDVYIPVGNTGLPPYDTKYFQEASIQTRISRGSIEILNRQLLAAKGEKLKDSHQSLINLLKFKPFKQTVIPKALFVRGKYVDNRGILEMRKALLAGLRNLQAFSVEADIYNELSGIFYIARGMKSVKDMGITLGIIEKEEPWEKSHEIPEPAPERESDSSGSDLSNYDSLFD